MSTNNARAIQIVERSENHSFVLKTDELKPILNSIEIRDRHVVVVSVAGALRQCKSFLLNNFLQFLNAQYNRKNAAEFLENNDDSSQNVDGFSWRSGSKPDTNGILIWPDIFTHDYENGEKIAVILMDTQGSFDSECSIRNCSTIFALSTMLSSVQCYNVMRNIREDDLQYLHLFTEYGKMCLQNSDEKPFQDLIFVVRDWPFARENAFGWEGGQQMIDNRLCKTDKQTKEMQDLRDQLKMSFSNICGFLMPHPGTVVAEDPKYNGNWNDMTSNFKEMLKSLVCKLLSPDKLITKKVDGQSIKAKDFLEYFKAYTTVFNSNKMPDPQSIYKATAETYNLIVCNDAQLLYNDVMERTIREKKTNFTEDGLKSLHLAAKNRSIQQFKKAPRFGGRDAVQEAFDKLQMDIERKFNDWKLTNEAKRKKIEADNLAAQKEALSYYRKSFERQLLRGLFFSEEMMKSTNSRLHKEAIALYRKKQGISGYGFGAYQLQLRKKLNEVFLMMKLKNEVHKLQPASTVSTMSTSLGENSTRLSARQHVVTDTTARLGNLQINDMNDYVFECAVCLHADPEQPFVAISICGHIVHRRCLQGQTNCPQCRCHFTANHVFEVFLNLKSRSTSISNSECPEAPVSVNELASENVSQEDILYEIQLQNARPDVFVFGASSNHA